MIQVRLLRHNRSHSCDVHARALSLLGASALALFLTIQLRGDDIRLATNVSLSARFRAGNSTYDLAQAQIFTKALYYVNNQYFDKTRLDPRRMLVGALDFLQRDVPEILGRPISRAGPQAGHGASQRRAEDISRRAGGLTLDPAQHLAGHLSFHPAALATCGRQRCGPPTWSRSR